ncbi:MAG: EAL domain-containing protein [Oscillospiraceae bacterium]|nr:EAL domain-containing protein [Oscillospiraceae bacterium]
MNMRIGVSLLLGIIVAVLVFCGVKGIRSRRSIGRYVGILDFALIPPVLGNIIVICTSSQIAAEFGYYIYFIGMNAVMCALVSFTCGYCKGVSGGQQKPLFLYVVLIADTVQVMLNIFTGHVFDTEAVDVGGRPYYRVVSHSGHLIHMIIDYAAFVCVILIFIIAAVKTAKIYREKYLVMVLSLGLCGVCEVFYIISRIPIDRSVIGFGVCGILAFYFSLYYRPMRLLDRMLSNIAWDMTDALFLFDPTFRCIWANDAAMRLIGLESSEVDTAGEALVKLFGPAGRDYHEEWCIEKVTGTDEQISYYSLRNHLVTEERNVAGSFLVVRDNTEERRKMQHEIYNSTHDTMTGLYTKEYFYRCVRDRLSGTDGDYLAIFVDVKNFKLVNDIFSREFGDKAILQIADAIRNCMTRDCVYGRLGGDTFGVLVPKDIFRARSVERLLSGFTVSDGKIEHHLLIHIGVYEVTDRSVDVSVIFDRAHLAISSITDIFNTHIAVYDSELRDKVLWEQKIALDLHEAIEQKQLRPYLQPIADSKGNVVGAEALARWIHPEHGFMPPAMFIPVFEKNGMIVDVDRYMWRCACELLSKWKGTHDDLFISVNISPKDFYFCDVVSEIQELIREFDLEPSRLRIEITESVMMNDAEDKMKILSQLHDAGFVVEMDDFGSGYSSLNLLKDMPVDVLKVDMKFLSRSESMDRAKKIIKSIISLSYELDITSLTEGVETETQYTDLFEMGCKLFQGYYFAKPMPVSEFEEFTFGVK